MKYLPLTKEIAKKYGWVEKPNNNSLNFKTWTRKYFNAFSKELSKNFQYYPIEEEGTEGAEDSWKTKIKYNYIYKLRSTKSGLNIDEGREREVFYIPVSEGKDGLTMGSGKYIQGLYFRADFSSAEKYGWSDKLYRRCTFGSLSNSYKLIGYFKPTSQKFLNWNSQHWSDLK